MLKLIIEDDEGKQTVVPLIRDEITIGRKDGNTIRLTEKNISRRHARLLKQNGAVFVEDVGSFNGVKLNGVRIGARSPIGEGDLVSIGDYRLSVRMDRPGVAPGGAGGPRATVMGMAPPGVSAGGGPVSEGTTSPGMPRVTQEALAGGAALPPPVAAPPYAPVSSPLPPPSAPAALPPPGVAAPLPVPMPISGPVQGHAMLPAPGDPMEGTPTIPVRTLADQGLVPGATPPARLVIVSTELAGAEFVLDRASVVVGRTDENDIVVNHRSISRHHAKIVREGDRYTVVDLQSANGVRVNGEEYERTEVKAGDTLELGHVRLRFVGGNESFTFDPSLVVAPSRRSPVKLLLGIGGGVAAVVIIAVALFSGGEKPKSKLVEAPRPGVAAPTVTPSIAPTAPAAPGASADELYAKGLAAAKSERWEEAHAALTAALGVDAGDARARDLLQKVGQEQKHAELYASLKAAADAKAWDDAVKAWATLPEDSVYKDRARPLWTAVRPRFVQSHLEQAERLRGQGRCDEVKQETDIVLAVDEKNRAAREVLKFCRHKGGGAVVAAAAPAPAPRRERPAPEPRAAPVAVARPEPPRAAPPPPPRAPEEPAGDPQALLKQARTSYFGGQYAAAIDAARKAVKAKPGFTDAYQIMAAAYCSLKDADGVGKVYGRLDDKNKQLVRSLCQRNGISLD